MTTTLLLARHGETDWNRDGRWQGHADRRLTDVGREQARALGRALAAYDLAAAYSSDLARAQETAELAVAGRGVGVVALPELRERSFGAWEGLRDDEVPRTFPAEYERWIAGEGHGPADAEPYETLVARVERAIRRIARDHPGETVLVVSHGGPVRVVAALADGVDFVRDRASIPAAANCALSVFAVEGDALRRLD